MVELLRLVLGDCASSHRACSRPGRGASCPKLIMMIACWHSRIQNHLGFAVWNSVAVTIIIWVKRSGVLNPKNNEAISQEKTIAYLKKTPDYKYIHKKKKMSLLWNATCTQHPILNVKGNDQTGSGGRVDQRSPSQQWIKNMVKLSNHLLYSQ